MLADIVANLMGMTTFGGVIFINNIEEDVYFQYYNKNTNNLLGVATSVY